MIFTFTYLVKGVQYITAVRAVNYEEALKAIYAKGVDIQNVALQGEVK